MRKVFIIAWWEKTAKWSAACVHKLTCINAAHWTSQEKLAEWVVACGHHLISRIPAQWPAFLVEKKQIGTQELSRRKEILIKNLQNMQYIGMNNNNFNILWGIRHV